MIGDAIACTTEQNLLGEGVVWDARRDELLRVDILAGRVFMDVSEDDDADDDALPVSDVASLTLSPQLERGAARPPMMGTFATDKSDTLRRAVVDGSRCPVPSPFPRHRRRNPSVSWSGRSMSGVRVQLDPSVYMLY